MQLLKAAKITPAITTTAGAAASTAVKGAAIDMAGFEGVVAVVTMGAIVTGAATSIKLQHGDTSDLDTSGTDVEGTNQTVADSDDDKVFYVDLFRPLKRYVRVVVSRATQNATIGSANYIQYGARTEPVAHAAKVGGETFVSPASGTA
jgi:hypothetical protein